MLNKFNAHIVIKGKSISLISLLSFIYFTFINLIYTHIMSTEMAKKAEVSLKKEDLINELKNAGVDIDVIRAAIQNEEEKGKGAK